jgi:transposase-like protein
MESMGRNKPRPRRSFTPEFKAEIVELCQREDRSVGQVARDFGLTETAVREWVKQAERDAGTRVDGGLTSAEQRELAELRRENRRLREDAEILKRRRLSSRRRPGDGVPVHRGGEGRQAQRRPGFQPLLYQLATGGLAGSDVAYPARAAARRYGAVFRHGELASIDPAARQITLTDGARIGYDYLILATGVAAYHGIPGAAEHSLGLYTRHDAIALRDRIMAVLDRISRTGLRDDLTVTVIGGGATGVELAGSLADPRNIALPASFPEIDRSRVHITLVQHGPALLAPFLPALRDYTRRQLINRGVDVRLGTAIAEITPGKVLSPAAPPCPATSPYGPLAWPPRRRSAAGACHRQEAADS